MAVDFVWGVGNWLGDTGPSAWQVEETETIGADRHPKSFLHE